MFVWTAGSFHQGLLVLGRVDENMKRSAAIFEAQLGRRTSIADASLLFLLSPTSAAKDMDRSGAHLKRPGRLEGTVSEKEPRSNEAFIYTCSMASCGTVFDF